MRCNRLIPIVAISLSLSLALPAGAGAAPADGAQQPWARSMREAMRSGGIPFGPGMMAGRGAGVMMRGYGYGAMRGYGPHHDYRTMPGAAFDGHDGINAALVATIAIVIAALATAAAMIGRRQRGPSHGAAA